MTLDSERTAPEATSTVVPATWWKTLLMYLAIVVPLALLARFLIVFGIFAGLGLIIVAVPYTVVVTVKLTKLRRAADLEARTSGVTVEPVAARFRTTSQQLSLINAAALGVTAVVWLVLYNTANESTPMYESMVLLAVLSVLEIVVNAPWIYSKKTAIAEAHAIEKRTAARTVILLNRRLSWAIWYIGAIAAVVIVANYIITGIASNQASIY